MVSVFLLSPLMLRRGGIGDEVEAEEVDGVRSGGAMSISEILTRRRGRRRKRLRKRKGRRGKKQGRKESSEEKMERERGLSRKAKLRRTRGRSRWALVCGLKV